LAASTISKKRQQYVIDNKFIDLYSDDPNLYKELDGQPFEIALNNVAAAFIEAAADNLDKADRVSSGALLDSIKQSEIQILGKTLSIDISVLDYYKFIDKGVKGWQSGNPSDSPYEFKQPQKGGSGKKSSDMVTAIRKWLIKEGLASQTLSRKSPTHAISSREKRRQKITDTSTSKAIVISGMIRKHGLKKTNFWTDAEATATKSAEAEFGEALQISLINSL
jgi:hypothetical protein